MNSKVLVTVAVAAAVVAMGVSGVIIVTKRADVAQARVEIAERLAEKARHEKSAAADLKRAEELKYLTAVVETNKLTLANAEMELKLRDDELQAKSADDLRKAKEDEKAAAQARRDEEREKANQKKREAEAERERTERETKLAQLELAKSNATAQAAADALAAERLRSEAIVAEAKALELRKIDFETIERELIEYRLELDERERALHPDKTSADLVWVAEREAETIGMTNVVRRKKKVLPEDDKTLPMESRRLARAERLTREDVAGRANSVSNRIVTALSDLYYRARREDRVVDADFYLKEIRLLYPSWMPVAQ